MPVMGSSNVTGWMARNQVCTARCVREEEEEEAESVGERRDERKSERVRQGFMRTS
jgi:hypothetical protein